MAISFVCGECGKGYDVDESLAGKRARCKSCGNEFRVPRPVAAAAAVPASRPREDVYGFDEPGGKALPPRSAAPQPAPLPRGGRPKKRASRTGSSGADPTKLIGALVFGVLAFVGVVFGLKYTSLLSLGGETEYDRVIQEIVRDGNQFASLLESVHDESSARIVAGQVRGLAQKFEILQKRMEAMPKPSGLEDAKLNIKYEAQVTAVVERMRNSVAHVQSIPGALEALRGSFAPLTRFAMPPPPRMPTPPVAPFQPPAGPGSSPPFPQGPGFSRGGGPGSRFQPPTPPAPRGPRMGIGRGGRPR